MNVFSFHPEPYTSALWLDDLRKNKMILESAQMLSTAMHLMNSPDTDKVYKSTHVNHPANVWVRSSRANFKWTLDWMIALGEQRGKPHKSLSLVPHFEEFYSTGDFSNEELTPFVNCARKAPGVMDFTHVVDSCDAYRRYLSMKWDSDDRRPTWFNGSQPNWYAVRDYDSRLSQLTPLERVQRILGHG